MIGAYVRLAPAELARVLDDPAWGEEHVEALVDAEDGRCFDVDKAWDAIGFLVRRADFPVDVVHGGEDVDGADDWDFGPPRLLPPAQVRQAAGAFAAVDVDALVDGLDRAELAAAEVHPSIWDEPDALEYVREHLAALSAFLATAARDGDAVLLRVE
jgi:hypothetical protein